MSHDPMSQGLTRILVPTDFSDPAGGALGAALALGRGSCREICALHVVRHDLPLGGDMGIVPAPVVLDPATRARLNAELQGFASRARRDGIATRVFVCEGEPADVIVREARVLEADLVAMGRHGRGLIDRVLLGSVTEAVVKRASCPVLVVSETVAPPRAVTRILCAVDLHAGSRTTSEKAVALARVLGAELSLIHVVEDVEESHRAEPAAAGAPHVDALRALQLLVPDDALPGRIERRIVAGEPSERILHSSGSGQADLVVVGAPTRHAVLGATARHVLRAAMCPVLLVPPPTAAASTDAAAEQEHVLVWK